MIFWIELICIFLKAFRWYLSKENILELFMLFSPIAPAQTNFFISSEKSLDFSQTIESYKPLTVLVPLSLFSRLMLHACDLNLTTRSHAAHTFIILVFVHQTSWQKKGPNDRCGSFVFQTQLISMKPHQSNKLRQRPDTIVFDVWKKEKQIFSAKLLSLPQRNVLNFFYYIT